VIDLFKRITIMDKHTKEVFLKSSSTVVIQIIGVSARLITSIILGRILGAAGLGEVNLINQVITIVAVLSMFGMDHVLVKKIAISNANQNHKQVGNAVYTALVTNVLVAFLLTTVGVLCSKYISITFNSLELQIPLIISLIVIIPQTIGGVFASSINGYNKIWQSRLLKDFSTSLIVLLGICALWFLEIPITLFSVIILYAIGRIATFLIASIYWTYLFKPIFIKDILDKSMLKMAKPLLFVSATSLLLTSVDILMLGWLSNASNVGLYTVATRLVLFIAFFLQITNSAVSPKIATFYANKQFTEMNLMVKQVTFWLIFIGVLSLLFFLFFGKPILGLWGGDFKEAYICLIILCFGQFVNISTGCSGVLLIMSGNEKVFSYISGFFLLLNLVLNYFLILRYDIIGAAAATTITIAGENIVRVIVAKQKTGILTIPIGLKKIKKKVKN
jgi:O-antigen/teichoic acid export membrane protein